MHMGEHGVPMTGERSTEDGRREYIRLVGTKYRRLVSTECQEYVSKVYRKWVSTECRKWVSTELRGSVSTEYLTTERLPAALQTLIGENKHRKERVGNTWMREVARCGRKEQGVARCGRAWGREWCGREGHSVS